MTNEELKQTIQNIGEDQKTIDLAFKLLKEGSITKLNELLEKSPRLLLAEQEENKPLVAKLIKKSYTSLLMNYTQYIPLDKVIDLGAEVVLKKEIFLALIDKGHIKLLDAILSHNPSQINLHGSKGYLFQLLIENGYTTILNQYNKEIDLNISLGNGLTLANLLVRKGYISLLENLLERNPQQLNIKDGNGVTTAQMLLNAGYNNLLIKFSKFIDGSLENKKQIPFVISTLEKGYTTLVDVLIQHNPQLINIKTSEKILAVDLINKGMYTLLHSQKEALNFEQTLNSGTSVSVYLAKKNTQVGLDLLVHYLKDNPFKINQLDKNNESIIKYLIENSNRKIVVKFQEYIDKRFLNKKQLNKLEGWGINILNNKIIDDNDKYISEQNKRAKEDELRLINQQAELTKLKMLGEQAKQIAQSKLEQIKETDESKEEKFNKKLRNLL